MLYAEEAMHINGARATAVAVGLESWIRGKMRITKSLQSDDGPKLAAVTVSRQPLLPIPIYWTCRFASGYCANQSSHLAEPSQG